MAVPGAGVVCYPMIIYKSELSRQESQKPQNLIFTGCSHKAIAEHAGLSTAQLQQQAVNAKSL